MLLAKIFGFDEIFYRMAILKVKEWLQNLGIGDHLPVMQEDDDGDEVSVPVPVHSDESAKNR